MSGGTWSSQAAQRILDILEYAPLDHTPSQRDAVEEEILRAVTMNLKAERATSQPSGVHLLIVTDGVSVFSSNVELEAIT